MKSISNLRDAIIRAHNRGKKVMEISEFLGIPHPTVSKTIKRFEETGSNKDRPGRGRKLTARTPANKRKIKGRIQRNPSSRKNSARKMGAALGISEGSVRNILHKDFGMKSRKEAKAQNLDANKIPKRLIRCRGYVCLFLIF